MNAVTTARMKEIDEKAITELHIPSLELMENAARHVAAAVLEEIRGQKDAEVVIVCGTGNNGGDGLACARLLMEQGIKTTVFLAGSMEKCTPDALANARRLQSVGGVIRPWAGEGLPKCSCIVDALFGFGLNREVTGLYRQVIAAINSCPAPVIACDIPSGLNGDTGEVWGAAVKAQKTVSFTRPKIGLTKPEAREYVGQLTVADIGIPEILLKDL